MFMTWNADADAKLFLGVLSQLQDAKLKLDYDKLAEYMGPDCISGAVVNRIKKLRRKAGAGDGAEARIDGAAADGTAGPAAPGTPAGSGSGAVQGQDNEGALGKGSPQKRKARGRPRGSGGAGRGRGRGRGRGGKNEGGQTRADADADAGAGSDSENGSVDGGEKMVKTEVMDEDEDEAKKEEIDEDLAERMRKAVGDDEIA